jgi:polar amino acid transport system substrate-binding protein
MMTKILFFIVCLVIVNVKSIAFSAERVIRLATLSWEPYVIEHIENYGFISEIVSRTFEEAGYPVVISFMPWIRVLAEVKAGAYDAMYPAYYSEERARNYAMSTPITDSFLVLCKRCDASICYEHLLDLKPYKIGVVRGYINTTEIDSASYLDKALVNSDKQNLLKLLTGRIDLAVIDKYAARQIIRSSIPQAAGKLCCLEPPLEKKQLYVGFSKAIKDYPKLLQDFNRSFDKLATAGVIGNIINRQGF